MRLKYLSVIKFRYLNVPCEGKGCTPPPLKDNFGVWGFMTLPLGFQLPKCASLLLSCTSQMTTNLYQSSCPRVACGFHCFHFDQWEMNSTGWTFKDRYSDPRTRDRNNVLDQLVPSHTQRGQANGQLVPHQLKPTTGKYLSSLRHLRSRLLVRSLPNM